jgi:hypothetical protein
MAGGGGPQRNADLGIMAGFGAVDALGVSYGRRGSIVSSRAHHIPALFMLVPGECGNFEIHPDFSP